jgi:hypothetical protein
MRLVYACLMGLALATAACNTNLTGITYGPADTTPAKLPTASPDIKGTLTKISTGEGGGTLLIEADPKATSGSPKASVKLNASTAMARADGVRVQFDAFKTGQTVQAWFAGPVAESYPVQATASAVQILSQ